MSDEPSRTSSDTPLVELQVTYEDDPQVVADARVNDYAGHIVPNSQRASRFSLTMAQYGFVSALFYIVTGAAVAGSVGTQSALIGLVLTVIAYSVISVFLSQLASRSGLNIALLSRSIFGRAGSVLAALIVAATLLYYFVFEGTIIGVAFHYQFGGNLNLWLVIVCIVSALLVLKGVTTWLDKINGFLLPFYLIGLVGAVVWAAIEYGDGWGWLTMEGAGDPGVPGWLAAFTSYMGVWILIMIAVEYGRLAKPEDKTYHSWITFGPVFYTLLFLVSGVVGIYLAATVPLADSGFGESEAAIAIVELMGILGVLFILVTQLRINTGNLYISTSNFKVFFNALFGVNLPRAFWVIVITALGYVAMISGVVLQYVLQALAYQGVFVTAWVAIVVVHGVYAIRTGHKFEARPWRVPAINPAGMLAWFGSVAIGIALITVPGIPPAVVTLAPLITVAIAAGIYGFALWKAKSSWFRLDRHRDPSLEVADPEAARIQCTECRKAYVALEMDRADDPQGSPYCATCASGRPVEGVS